jgi:hypothetical protein
LLVMPFGLLLPIRCAALRTETRIDAGIAPTGVAVRHGAGAT